MAEAPIRNPELVLAMNVLKAEDTPAARKAFAQAMNSAKFLAPVKLEQVLDEHDRQPDGSVALQQKTQVRYVLLNRSDGAHVFPAFTDWDELKKWNSEPCQTVILTVKEYMTLVAKEGANAAGVAINPMGQNIFLDKRALAPMPANLIDLKKPLQIATPNSFPEGLTEAVQNALAAQPTVQAGWLRMLRQENKLAWLVVIRLDEGTEAKPLTALIGQLVAPKAGGIPVAVASEKSPLGKQASEKQLPLYLRGNE